MKAIFLTNSKGHIENVYHKNLIAKLQGDCELDEKVYGKLDILSATDQFVDVEIIFSTWGMPVFTIAEIETYLPNVKALFYAAGSVQEFATPFLKKKIKIFSAYAANAIPVSEFAFAEIALATKGYFQSARKCKLFRYKALKQTQNSCGNFQSKIGIVGVGAIGKMVCEKLQTLNCQIYVYDPFLKAEIAERYHLIQTDLETIFKSCDVISNHLANKKELENLYNYDLFRLMKPYSTFINTGRGKQVNERGLVKAMRQDKTRTALLDVTSPDIPLPFSPIRFCKNIITTPHIAGSLANELWRMSEYMFEEFLAFKNNKKTKYEVTLELLKTMA